jgi:glycosyltransferase involved in cell wall biosynthesis
VKCGNLSSADGGASSSLKNEHSMKKILLISNRLMHYRVGVYNYFHDRFKEQGYSFIVRANEMQRGNAQSLKFDFRELPFNFFLYKDEVIKIRPDIVILFLHLKDPVTFPLLYWLRIAKIPVIYWTKGMNLDDPNNHIRRILFHHAHNLANGIILYSEHELPFIQQKNRKKITVANNTLNYLDFPDIDETKEMIKQELNIRFKKIALFTGRMDVGGGRKKVDHAIRLFRQLDNPDYGLVIVGSGFNHDHQKIMNHKNTVYLGEIHDISNILISKIFKMSDLFLMPGHVGLGLNQAFYWKLPVLTEEGGQPPEIHYLVNGRNGYIVGENDIGALKEKVIYLFDHDQERERLGRNAKEDLLKKASIENMFDGFLSNIELRMK